MEHIETINCRFTNAPPSPFLVLPTCVRAKVIGLPIAMPETRDAFLLPIQLAQYRAITTRQCVTLTAFAERAGARIPNLWNPDPTHNRLSITHGRLVFALSPLCLLLKPKCSHLQCDSWRPMPSLMKGHASLQFQFSATTSHAAWWI